MSHKYQIFYKLESRYTIEVEADTEAEAIERFEYGGADDIIDAFANVEGCAPDERTIISVKQL